MIRKTILTIAAAASLAMTFAGAAEARRGFNGGGTNGYAWNGIKMNGYAWNGYAWNGAKMNGTQQGGVEGGVTVLSVELPR
jgi:opacity protein-like surface antigen